jgi:hypothetical protein
MGKGPVRERYTVYNIGPESYFIPPTLSRRKFFNLAGKVLIFVYAGAFTLEWGSGRKGALGGPFIP